jgi:hypothetical protein
MFRKYAKKIRYGVEVKTCRDCGGPERPCLVDGKPATFHRWVDEDKALLQFAALMRPEDRLKALQIFNGTGTADSSSTIEKLRTCFALVEYPDGSVGKVKPELIQFLGRKEG